MNEKQITELIAKLKADEITEADFINKLKVLDTEDVHGFASIDHHRALRTGFPEVIFAEGKTVEQVVEIFIRLKSNDQPTPMYSIGLTPQLFVFNVTL